MSASTVRIILLVQPGNTVTLRESSVHCYCFPVIPHWVTMTTLPSLPSAPDVPNRLQDFLHIYSQVRLTSILSAVIFKIILDV